MAGRGEILNKILYRGAGEVCPIVQPLTLLYTILDRKDTPFVYLLLISGTLYLFYFIHFATTNVQRKEEKKNALQNRSGVEALNRNHRAYNIRPSSITTHDGYTCSAMTINSKKRMDEDTSKEEVQSVCKFNKC